MSKSKVKLGKIGGLIAFILITAAIIAVPFTYGRVKP